MNLWIIFYLILTPLLLLFYFYDKKIEKYFDKYFDKFLENIKESKSKKEFGNYLTLFAYIISLSFFFNIDKTPDISIKIKAFGLIGIFIINCFLYFIKKNHEWIFILNLAMLIWCGKLFNIFDSIFIWYLVFNIFYSLILMFLFFDKKNAKKKLNTILKSIWIIVIVFCFQTFYFTSMTVPTGSMLPKIQLGDTFWVNMFDYKFKNPKRNEIIVFLEPMNNHVLYTKRLVGLPGEVLQIEKGPQDTFKIYNEQFQKFKNDIEINNNDLLPLIGGRLMANNKAVNNNLYLPEGFVKNIKTYIPKKGDKVKLDKIIAIDKMEGYDKFGKRLIAVDWNGFNAGTNFKIISPQNFKEFSKNYSNFSKMIGNSDNKFQDKYYTFTLKAEGHSELVLPILDFKYNNKQMQKLLNGESITLNQDYYVGMGDNTANSFDSRYFGLISKKRIKGKVVFRWQPFNRIGNMKNQ